MKKCSKCHRYKQQTKFSKRTRNRDGLDEWCKKCKKKATNCWRGKNKNRIRKTGKAWRLENKTRVLQNKRNWRKTNPEKARLSVRKSLKKNYKKYQPTKWRRWLKKRYGVSEEQFLSILRKQKNRCAICRKRQRAGKRKKLYVDHCHKTNKFRGLLCFKCNVLLGMAQDVISTLQAAIQYLRRNSWHIST